jgi:biopolymer transport protein ExbD
VAGRFFVGIRCLALLAVLFVTSSVAHAEEPDRLTVFIHDGEVLFHGTELDLDQLKTQLTATGKQGARIYLRIGSSAKSVYVDRVVKTVQEAGFTDIAILGPSGMEKDLDPPV